MSLEFDTINILIALAAATNLLYGFLVYKRNNVSASNIAFFFLTIAVTAWGLTMIVFRSADSMYIALQASYWLYAAAAAIPTLFTLFVYLFPSDTYTLDRQKTISILAPFTLVILAVFTPNVLIQSVTIKDGAENIIVFNQFMHVLYALFVAGMFLVGHAALVRKYKETDGILRSQIIYILLGALVPTFVGLFSNLLLPIYNDFRWNWMGQISIAVTTGIITYGIFRHRIFNIRVIATEILIFFVWLSAFLRIVFSDNPAAVIFNSIMFVALVIVGLWLVRSVTREVETREKLEELTTQLQSANARLRELDRQKSEFLSIATHQLRGPLAGIRGHLSLIVDGSYGKVPERALGILKKVFQSSGMLAQTINDFLDVSRIEQGRMQYDKKEFDCTDLLKEIVDELKPIALERELKLSFESACKGEACVVYADYGKLRHIFFNLVDNAIKYTQEGWVKVRIGTTNNGAKIRVVVSDSGIGIASDEINALFEKFVRARDASGINVNGTGLGLYVAREMVEAHNGSIWAESEGKGEGSSFIVELPVSKKTTKSQK